MSNSAKTSADHPNGIYTVAATILVGSLSLLARGCLRRFATGAQGGREREDLGEGKRVGSSMEGRGGDGKARNEESRREVINVV